MNKIIIKNKIIDKNSFIVIAGPCTIDSREQLDRTAKAIKGLGVSFLRGGAFKMRTSPESWQGLGEKGLRYLKDVCDKYEMISVSEITSIKYFDMMIKYTDVLLVGTRNMQNYQLLHELGKTSVPIILKRGMASTIDEWLLAAEYITENGNNNLILCERGIRTFENHTRNTLDLSAIPIVKKLSSFPIIVDPSHATGRAELVKSMSWAAAGAGADGLMLECDVSPEEVKCDAQQTISINEVKCIKEQLPLILKLWDKELV